MSVAATVTAGGYAYAELSDHDGTAAAHSDPAT